jgi:hypothetical protein
VKRLATRPSGRGTFVLTDAMIDLRNRLAIGLGYVLRPCSLGPNAKTGEHFECWEKPELTCEWRGRMTSPYHCAPKSIHNINSLVMYNWPHDVEVAAYAIDKGKAIS